MQNNDRLQRALRIRHLGSGAAVACNSDETRSSTFDDLKLFTMTFVAGFLFTTIFIA